MKLNLKWTRDYVSPELKERELRQGQGYAKNPVAGRFEYATEYARKFAADHFDKEGRLQRVGRAHPKEKTSPFSSRQSIGSDFGNTQEKMTRTIPGQGHRVECSDGSGLNDTIKKNPTTPTYNDQMAKPLTQAEQYNFPPPPLPVKQSIFNDIFKWWLKNKCTRGKQCRFLHKKVQNG